MVRITHCGRQPRAQTNTFELSAPTSRSQSPTRPIMRDRAAVMSGVSRSGAGGLRSLWWAPLGRLIEMMPRSGAKSRNTPPTLQPSLSPLVNTIRDAFVYSSANTWADSTNSAATNMHMNVGIFEHMYVCSLSVRPRHTRHYPTDSSEHRPRRPPTQATRMSAPSAGRAARDPTPRSDLDVHVLSHPRRPV